MADGPPDELEQEFERLEAELRDRQAALPAHSVRPGQILAIEELEEKIKALKKRIGRN
ncbi:MAG TPA: histidine kinase [bacterium]|nr:histidine kinase [bacterium]